MPVSSTTHADTSSAGATRSAQARTSSAGSHGESAKNCCNDSYRAASSPREMAAVEVRERGFVRHPPRTPVVMRQ
jgi:hypothetical protein